MAYKIGSTGQCLSCRNRHTVNYNYHHYYYLAFIRQNEPGFESLAFAAKWTVDDIVTNFKHTNNSLCSPVFPWAPLFFFLCLLLNLCVYAKTLFLFANASFANVWGKPGRLCNTICLSLRRMFCLFRFSSSLPWEFYTLRMLKLDAVNYLNYYTFFLVLWYTVSPTISAL